MNCLFVITQVGTRAQSERIRTYNFTQDRVTDHRIAYEVRDIKVILLNMLYVLCFSKKVYSNSRELCLKSYQVI